MKKILFAALMISMVGVLSAATASVSTKNVYNYQASIKRLNANYYIATLPSSTTRTIADQYSVVSDTILGYVVIDRCVVCQNGTLTQFNNSTNGASKNAYAWLTRVGDTYHKTIFKVKADVTAALFGAYVAASIKGGKNTPYASRNNMNQAWMALNFTLPTYAQTKALALNTKLVMPTVAEGAEPLPYGFFGLDNTEAGYLRNSGFGVANVVTTLESSDLAWCDTPTTPGSSCQTIRTITGATIGDPQYQGPCGLTPMWDVCYDAVTDSVKDAVVCGTWVLVYDATLSQLADDEKDDAILTRLGAQKGYTNVVNAMP